MLYSNAVLQTVYPAISAEASPVIWSSGEPYQTRALLTMIMLTVSALVLVPAAYCATTANNCRIAGTVVGAVLGSSNGATLETVCADTSSFCKNNRKKNTHQRLGGSILASLSQSERKRRGAGPAPNITCEVATESRIAEAATSKDPNEVSKQIAKVVCSPSNYADWVSACNEAVKAATVSKGFDLSKVEGCETIQYIDNLGKPCTPQAV